MEFKGTKGPWNAVEYAGHYIIQTGGFYAEDDNILNYDNFSKEEVDANAQLTQEAPELLERLIEVATSLKRWESWSKGTPMEKVFEHEFLQCEKTINKALKQPTKP